jgi:hypothetical protein
MKRQILISLISLSSVLAVNAQTDFHHVSITGNNNATDFGYGIFGQSNVGLGLTSIHGGIGFWTGEGSGNVTETMRLWRGQLGIGTTTPSGLLDVQKTTSNAGGQSVVNIIGSTITGNGASLVLNQVWNDNYYKTIIDNTGGMYNQIGSGLKIQTSYWNGSQVNTITALSLSPTGDLGLGTTSPAYKLDVNGTIHAREIKVDLTGWSDFVFAPTYRLKPLSEVEQYIKTHGHLENIPTAEEVEQNGVSVGDMQKKLLEKVEQLMLYSIELKKENIEQQKQNTELQLKLAAQGKEIEQLKALIIQKLK